jgi:lipopolysaccharide/colanic/teichoic acid biosynthesis glycosyltransferase/glycosyltransferase involved in cell wall biosynthesis
VKGRIRLLQVIPNLLCGGAERLLADLVLHLDRGRYEPAVFSLYAPAQTALERELAAAGIPVFHAGKRPGFDVRVPFRLYAALRRFRPDIVHTHRYALHYALPALLLWRRPRVHTVHVTPEHDGSTWLLPARLAYAGGVIPVAVSAEVAAGLRRLYGSRAVRHIPNGIRVAHYRAEPGARERVRAALGLRPDDLVLLNVARLMPQKNHALLFTAFQGLAEKVPAAALLLAGTGELEAKLRATAERLGIAGRVRFLGVRTDVPDLLAACDAFVLSSSWEGNPLSLMEAMAAGRAVIATRVGGVPELVRDGVTGRLVPPGDEAALRQAMQELAADGALRDRLGQAAAAEATARFDIAAMAGAYDALYGDLLAGRAATVPTPGLSRSARAVKRSFDIALAVPGLILAGPVIVALAAAVRLTSPGPAFFRQVRAGRHGRPFRICKLRTMAVAQANDRTVTTAGDPRITPFGRFLRRAKLDELPQLWNIAKGDMSFVGPRPDMPSYAEGLRGDDRRILELRPGVTGPATLAFRDEEKLLASQPDPVVYNDRVIFPAKVRMNLAYLEHWSFGRDLGYLLLTVAPAFDRWLRLIPEPPAESPVTSADGGTGYA